MSRKTRIEALGALHHIILRGIERKPIFKSEIDPMVFWRKSRGKYSMLDRLKHDYEPWGVDIVR